MQEASTPLTVDAGLLLFGAGGHGRVVADAALCAGWQGVFASDRDPARCEGLLVPGVPRVRDVAQWRGAVHVCIGDNAARERESASWSAERLATVIHPRAVVSASAIVAPGCFVAACAVVAPSSHAGRGVILNHGAVLDHDARVGAWSHVAPGVKIGGGALIGDHVLLGSGAVVLPGVRIAAGSVIGAGAVVPRSIEEPGVYVGVPARRVA